MSGYSKSGSKTTFLIFSLEFTPKDHSGPFFHISTGSFFLETAPLSVFALFMYGLTDGVSMIIRQTILQLKTPDEFRGRVASVNSIFVGSSNELGAFESGVTAKLMGTVPAVVFGGVMTILTVGFTSIKFPNFRKLDLTKYMNEN